jgi:hypothetical protein
VFVWLGYANSPEEGGSSARKMARYTAGLDLSFKHTEDRAGGGGHRDDLDDDDEDETTGTRDQEDDQDEEPNQTSASGDEPVQRSVSGTAARRRKPLAPQWVNPDWTEPAADGAPAAQPEGTAAQRLNRSWEDRQQDEKEGDSRTINGVCVMMNPAAFCGQPAAAAEAAGRVWVARNMED